MAGMSDDQTTATPVLEVSEAARAQVLEVRASEQDPDALALWVEVNGASGGAYTYDIWFQGSADAGADDHVGRDGDLVVVVPASSVDRMRGATLDVDASSGGMVIRNPNRPAPAAGSEVPTGDITGEVAQAVIRVLDEHVNPGIASHGGRADLVAVEDDVAYLRLSGGCQGCGLAKVTLSQGIEVAITEAVPEITRVVDVTDHASGSNPFYEPSKK